MIRSVLLLGVIGGALGTQIHFQDCGALGSYMVEDVYLDVPCPKQPCWLPLKKQTNTTVTFKSSKITALDVTPEAYMKDKESIRKFDTVPIKCPKSVCPIQPEEKKGYSILLRPNFTYPTTTVKVYLELFNQKHEKLFCVFFHAKIYDPELTKPSGFHNDI